MGGDHQIKVPDYRLYKVEGIPELEKIQRMLKAKGLKDPWLRNEVWRFLPENYTPPMQSMVRSLGRGFKWAAAAMVVTIIAEKIYAKSRPESEHDEGHH